MSDFVNIWKNLDWSVPVQIVVNILPSLLCITLHELSHGYVAYRLGDTTAKDAGRLTLNPIKHIDIMGLLMMVVFRFGWAKPVPVNMYRFKNPKKGMAVTALAGPACNFLLALLFLFLYGLLYYPLYVHGGAVAETVLQLVYTTAYLSLALAVFNLIPVPPLDGSRVLLAVLPERIYFGMMKYERVILIVLLAAVWGGFLDGPLSVMNNVVWDLLDNGTQYIDTIAYSAYYASAGAVI